MLDQETSIYRKILTCLKSTGPYVVMWKLSDVCKGRTYDYTMQKFDKPVVAAGFHYQKRNKIIVTVRLLLKYTSSFTPLNNEYVLFYVAGR